MINRADLQEAIFTMMDEEAGAPRYLGLYNPAENWNGWAKPYFKEETAHQILKNAVETEALEKYTFENDIFSSWDNPEIVQTDGTPETWEAVEIDGVKYYPIGAGLVTWVGEENKLFFKRDKSGRGGHYNISSLEIYNDEDEHEDDEDFYSWLYECEIGDEYTEFSNRKYTRIS